MTLFLMAMLACGPKQPMAYPVAADCASVDEVTSLTVAALRAVDDSELQAAFSLAEHSVMHACEPLSQAQAADYLLAHARQLDVAAPRAPTDQQKAVLLGLIWASPNYAADAETVKVDALITEMERLRKAPTFGALQSLDPERGTWFVNGTKTTSLPGEIEAIVQLQNGALVRTLPREEATKMLAESTAVEVPAESNTGRMGRIVGTVVAGAGVGIAVIAYFALQALANDSEQ